MVIFHSYVSLPEGNSNYDGQRLPIASPRFLVLFPAVAGLTFTNLRGRFGEKTCLSRLINPPKYSSNHHEIQ